MKSDKRLKNEELGVTQLKWETKKNAATEVDPHQGKDLQTQENLQGEGLLFCFRY